MENDTLAYKLIQILLSLEYGFEGHFQIFLLFQINFMNLSRCFQKSLMKCFSQSCEFMVFSHIYPLKRKCLKGRQAPEYCKVSNPFEFLKQRIYKNQCFQKFFLMKIKFFFIYLKKEKQGLKIRWFLKAKLYFNESKIIAYCFDICNQSIDSYKIYMDKASNNSTKGVDSTPRRSRWDATPVVKHDLSADGPKKSNDQTPLRVDQTPSRFSSTPMRAVGETPRRWDDKTPLIGQTPGYAGATPTPSNLRTPDILHMAPSKLQQLRWEKQLQERNRPYTDEQLNMLLPGDEDGYQIVKVPQAYRPQKKNQNYLGTPQTQQYQMPEVTSTLKGEKVEGTSDLPPIKPEQYKFFGTLLQNVNESQLTLEEQKERKILALLLKIKEGNPHVRKVALRQITINAVQFGAGPLFNNILPLLMSQGLDPQQRHLLVKVIDRVLYKLDELVRPYVHKILVVIEPLLIDEDYYARVQGRQIISNLAKAAGLPTMIKTMRPDIDHKDEFVRNTTSRAFAVVASALGIGAIIPFLKAVCSSKKSWEARHTGTKIVQQIAILMGCSVLPYLKQLVDTIKNGLDDSQKKVKSMTALAISSLAEASAPYGIEAFDDVLIPLWKLTTQTKDKTLGAFLKAIGFIIPLMDSKHTAKYTESVLPAIILQFRTNQEQLRKIILKVLKQIIGCNGVQANYIRKHMLQQFFDSFWIRRMAIEKRNYKQLIQTTVQIAKKVGVIEIVDKIYRGLKDENEAYRKMVMQGIEKIVSCQSGSDISHAPQAFRNELMDCALTALHEQTTDDAVILNGFGAIINAMGLRAKPYFVQIVGTINWRLNNKSIRIRQQAADLVSKIAHCMKICGEETRLGRLGLNLNECLRQQYPEVLGSILGALKEIVIQVGMTKMTPPIKDLLPRLTPILKNRNEKVQQNCIELVGRIADKGSQEVSPKQWMRICFDLLQLLKAHKRSIRRAAVTTFGYIAKAIGPQDVLVTLLNNLKVQQRQLRICTTVAIAIVAESCGPFTVLPALMNEYRVQQLNVQNGVLKSLAFMFEYIGEMAKDYIYAVTPLLEDALTDRDLVHRQTAAAAIKHLALGVQGFGNEDALIHLLNYIWPNIFETSPHVVNAVLEAIEAIRLSVGPGVVLMYVLQGLWHPARRVRQVYWRIYNMLYVGSQDNLVPFQPILKDDQYNHYGQPQLMMGL